jgi:hypothetical protein
MGWQIKDVLDLHPQMIYLAVDAHLHERAMANREEWERIRFLATVNTAYSGELKQGTKVNPLKMYPFPWDKVKKVKIDAPALTKEDLDIMSMFESIQKNRKDALLEDLNS